uniref:hypothetical protein n=1 Tax=Actinacidiphila yeochonensis TaxID=89050 RepID=UPI000A96514E
MGLAAKTRTAFLVFDQGIDPARERVEELVVIKELLGHAHIGVTATAYAHIRLRLQRDAIDTLSTTLSGPETAHSDGDEQPPRNALVR